MRFPNAAAGVKKIFTAEILGLIGAIATVIGTISALIAVAAAANNSTGGTAVAGGAFVIFLLGAGVLGIIAFIMNIIGINSAAKDEASFKTALICVIVGIAGTAIASIFSSNATISAIGTLISNVANLFVTIFVITGIIRLADQLNNGEVSAKGNNILKVIIVVYALSIIASLIVMILGGQTASIIAGIIALVAAILNIVQYFMYLSFLSKAKKMLEA